MKDVKTVEKKNVGGLRKRFGFSRQSLCIPYGVFLLFFVLFPLLLVVYYAFTSADGAFTFANNFC